MKSSTIAAVFNFCIPGAGLWYLGKRKLATVNFIIACVVPSALSIAAPELIAGRLHYVLLAIAAGSAGFAHAVATRNSRSQQAID